jgi:hypothetical protein
VLVDEVWTLHCRASTQFRFSDAIAITHTVEDPTRATASTPSVDVIATLT